VRSCRKALSGAVAATALVVLSACGSSSDPGSDTRSAAASSTPGSEQITVVASTDVWGDVVKQVAGDLAGSKVQITSIITDPDTDPHSYEANTQNQLALSKADVVIENGGGYDDFIDTMLGAANNDSAKVLNAVDISGKTAPAGGELNEHVWYDFSTVQKVTDQIVDTLSAAAPAEATTFETNAKAFEDQLATMEQTEASIKAAHGGEGAAITEPVPLYLLEACGLVNKTPDEFSEAIEEDSDVPASVLKETADLFKDKQVKVLAYNEQTTGPETEAVLKAAKDNGIPVVPVTETLPEGEDYLSWMKSNLSAIQTALG
jgi:zinc/manganese transport system substrate-binding protein